MSALTARGLMGAALLFFALERIVVEVALGVASYA